MDKYRLFKRDFPRKPGYSVSLLFSSMLFYFLAATSAFTGLTPAGVPQRSSHLPKIPAKPPSSVLKKVPLPDLTVISISLKPAGTKKPSQAWIIATVRNIGDASSKPTTMSGIHECKGKTVEKKQFRIRALKPGKTEHVRWLISRSAGENILTFTVHDTVHAANNTGKTSFRYFPLRKGSAAKPRGIPPAKGDKSPATTAHPSMTRPLPTKSPNVTVQNVTFRRGKTENPREAWLKVIIRNRGTAPSPRLMLAVRVFSPKGKQFRRNFGIRPLKPGQVTTIEGPLPMERGTNTIQLAFLPEHARSLRANIGPILTKRYTFTPPVRHISSRQGTRTSPAHPAAAPLVKSGNNGSSHELIPFDGHLVTPPDLKIMNVGIREEITDKHTIYFDLTLKNAGGDIPGTGDPHLIANISIQGPLGSEPTQEMTCPIDPDLSHAGGQKHLAFSFYPKMPGDYKVTARIKTAPRIRESNVRNNVVERSFHVRGLPDLQVYITHPSDVHVGTHKRWFRFFVKNTGEGTSNPTTLTLHIQGDGTHTYEVPSLAPGETFPEHGMKKRGIKWWSTGRKHYYILVEPVYEETNTANNKIEDSLYVYLGSHFNSSGLYDKILPEISHKRQPPYVVDKPARFVFRIYNPSNRVLTYQCRFLVDIEGPSDGTRKSLSLDVPPLMPGESYYKVFNVVFHSAGEARFHIQRYKVKQEGEREVLETYPLDPSRAEGTLRIIPTVGPLLSVGPFELADESGDSE